MGRCIEKDDCGNWQLRGVDWKHLREGQVITKDLFEKLYGALWKLMEYEEVDDDPDKLWSEKVHNADRRATEIRAAFMEDASDAKADRMLFVRNLGSLLSQTREGVLGCELDNKEIVTIYFEGGTRKVNVKCDSYTAIVKDVVKAI